MIRRLFLLCSAVLLGAVPALAGETRVVTDALGRQVTIPAKVERVICSGSGCLRLLTYLQAQNLAVAVDDIEGKRNQFDARPYAIANPGFRDLPVFGQFRGEDNPERILSLAVQPQVILKVNPEMGTNPVDLERKTGIPVVVLRYGDLGRKRPEFYAALRLVAQVTDRAERAEAVIHFFDARIEELGRRVAGMPDSAKPRVYVGGVAYKGPQGFHSTEPGYPPFLFLNARNVAAEGALTPGQTVVAKEKIVEWNPDALFLDLATLQLGEDAGGLHELKTDPAYQTLDAVKTGRVYGLLPYNWYSQNYGSILADAYYVGKVLQPERFQDVDPAVEADAIYSFLVGKPVFEEMNRRFGGMAFKPVPLR
ncbi:MAG: iron ABC transporter substrate-binding protein [Desulfovibrio aminophilus]|uniref:iron ABC transporter substrate-binding protein n=1 Tax=Desulfovibrio aminophilus TaxID=81425 RepID=UPI0004883879|nr:iron ABC transporter substrate-binding protein [Desulfovibrio aminophilus]MDY0306933.1 iron ABC transporter substrate-binding protein [Desulfovibrionaceae bacterium]